MVQYFTSSHPPNAVVGELLVVQLELGKSVYAWHWQIEADINTHPAYKESGELTFLYGKSSTNIPFFNVRFAKMCVTKVIHLF